jgi:molecular chaperone DnaJ
MYNQSIGNKIRINKFVIFQKKKFSFFKRTEFKLRNRNYNFYEVLGVEKNCSNEEIRAAYIKLAKQYHPDINKDPGSDDKFKTITLAYEALSNQRNRDLYDAYMYNDPYSQEWKYKEEQYRDDYHDSAKEFYRERAKYDNFSENFYREQTKSNFWGGKKENFEDEFYKGFDNVFNSGAQGFKKSGKDQKGEDILLEINIDLYESFVGVSKAIKFSRIEKCRSCRGQRSATGQRPSKCFGCNGTGEIKTSMFNAKKCNQCKGIGYIIKHPCK